MAIRLPRTTRGLAMAIAAVSGLLTTFSGVATYVVVHHEIERQIDHRIELETYALMDLYRAEGFATLARIVDQRTRRATPGGLGYLAGANEADRTMTYLLVDGAGLRKAGTLQARIPPVGWSEFYRFPRPDGREGVAQALHTPLPGGGALVVAADRAIVDQTDVALLQIFLAEFALILAILTLTAAAFGRIVQRRLNAIKGSAEAIMAGDLSRRMPVEGAGGEFDEMAGVLNRMLDRISHLVASLRHLSSDIAHDLRTPLGRLRSRLEQLEGNLATAPERAVVAKALEETDDLLDLFAGLLAISEVEGLNVQARFAKVDMRAAIDEIAEAYRPAFEVAGIDLATDLEPGEIIGDRALAQQALANLLDNVLAHTPIGTRVSVAGRTEGEHYRLRVHDSGPGVPGEDHQRMFSRMTRLDNARSTPGHGLGLSMVAAIAEAHGGSARIVDQGPGLTVEVSFAKGSPETPRAVVS